jgi:hypothetical protein
VAVDRADASIGKQEIHGGVHAAERTNLLSLFVFELCGFLFC